MPRPGDLCAPSPRQRRRCHAARSSSSDRLPRPPPHRSGGRAGADRAAPSCSSPASACPCPEPSPKTAMSYRRSAREEPGPGPPGWLASPGRWPDPAARPGSPLPRGWPPSGQQTSPQSPSAQPTTPDLISQLSSRLTQTSPVAKATFSDDGRSRGLPRGRRTNGRTLAPGPAQMLLSSTHLGCAGGFEQAGHTDWDGRLGRRGARDDQRREGLCPGSEHDAPAVLWRLRIRDPPGSFAAVGPR